jgi:hypothetical protein
VSYVARVNCPKCGRPGVLTSRNVKGKRYAYVAHWVDGKLKWCYVGAADDVLKTIESKGASSPTMTDPNGREARQPTGDEVKEYFAKLRSCSKPEYTDEELLKAIVKDARNDYFCGTGRIFISEFTKWYGCSKERLLSVLEKSNLKWRLDPNEVVVLIDL